MRAKAFAEKVRCCQHLFGFEVFANLQFLRENFRLFFIESFSKHAVEKFAPAGELRHGHPGTGEENQTTLDEGVSERFGDVH